MEIKNNQLTIDIPEGMEIDLESSDLAKGIIKFKSKSLTYEDISQALFTDYGSLVVSNHNIPKLLAIAKLMNIAEYYNKKCPKEEKKIHCINFDKRNLEYFIQDYTSSIVVRGLIPIFNNKEDAKAVIDNPNFKEILDLIYKCDED